jgi:hypothetical protein
MFGNPELKLRRNDKPRSPGAGFAVGLLIFSKAQPQSAPLLVSLALFTVFTPSFEGSLEGSLAK